MKIFWDGVAFFVTTFLFLAVVSASCKCPHFVEFFPDPKDVPDQEGEFIEIRLEDFKTDSLRIQMDGKATLALAFPRGKRLVLVHDSAYCPVLPEVACGLLDKFSLPNSREVSWLLQAGSCGDSVVLPVPKPGMSLQRVGESDRWVLETPTMGMAHPSYEVGLKDCGLGGILRDVFSNSGTDTLFRYTLFLTGCDSSDFLLEFRDMNRGDAFRDSSRIYGHYQWESAARNVWIRAELPPDEAPSNNLLDTLLLEPGGGIPLVLSEIHHCPQEPEPEWVEVYNRTSTAFPLSKFRFCNRGGTWIGDSIAPYESVLFSKDTAQLREVLGFKDVRLLQVALGFLNNTAGCLSICNGETVVDSVCWDKHTVTCPDGFNPITGAAENTPGFLRVEKDNFNRSARGGSIGKDGTPFTYKLSSRILRLGGNPLRVYVEGSTQVRLKLLDSAGRDQWHVDIPPHSNNWWSVPLQGLSIGVAYVSLSAGKFENVVGILIRP